LRKQSSSAALADNDLVHVLDCSAQTPRSGKAFVRKKLRLVTQVGSMVAVHAGRPRVACFCGGRLRIRRGRSSASGHLPQWLEDDLLTRCRGQSAQRRNDASAGGPEFRILQTPGVISPPGHRADFRLQREQHLPDLSGAHLERRDVRGHGVFRADVHECNGPRSNSSGHRHRYPPVCHAGEAQRA
jgi:hypothetical protein